MPKISPAGRKQSELLQKKAIRFYNKHPGLFKECANQDLLLEIDRLKKSNERLLNENLELKEIREELEDDLLLSCWDDHGYVSLKKAFEAYNRKNYGLGCSCENCVLRSGDEALTPVVNRDCFFFDMIRPVMEAIGITFAIEDPFESLGDDPDFHPNTASKYFHTVSSLKVALVFPRPYEDPFRVYYGRTLWEIDNPFDHPEIQKLRAFKEHLHMKPIVPADFVPCTPELRLASP